MSESFVPTIDFTKHEQEVAEELYAALSTVGFACFTGTGLCQKVGTIKLVVVCKGIVCVSQITVAGATLFGIHTW